MLYGSCLYRKRDYLRSSYTKKEYRSFTAVFAEVVCDVERLIIRGRVLEVDEGDGSGVLVPDDIPHDQVVVAEHDGTAEGRQLHLQFIRQPNQSIPCAGALLQPDRGSKPFLRYLKCRLYQIARNVFGVIQTFSSVSKTCGRFSTLHKPSIKYLEVFQTAR